MEDEVEIELTTPIELKGQTWESLKLREPTAGELRRAIDAGAGNDIGIAMSLISQVAAVPMKAVETMRQRDLGTCSSFFDRFSSSPKAGS